MFMGGLTSCETNHTFIFLQLHHLLRNCCSPSCGLLCVGSPGGPTKAAAGGQKLYREQTEVITGDTGRLTVHY